MAAKLRSGGASALAIASAAASATDAALIATVASSLSSPVQLRRLGHQALRAKVGAQLHEKEPAFVRLSSMPPAAARRTASAAACKRETPTIAGLQSLTASDTMRTAREHPAQATAQLSH